MLEKKMQIIYDRIEAIKQTQRSAEYSEIIIQQTASMNNAVE